MLVSLTDSGLSSHAQEDGDDIVFTTDKGEILKYEIESYASTTGTLAAWVKMPSLTANTDTYIYMYYGNSSVETQADPENVWDASYEAIWHFLNSNSASTTDSTANNVELSAEGGAATVAGGKINGAFLMDANSERLVLDENGQINPQGSISFWYKETTNCVGYNSFFAASDSQNNFTFYRNNGDTSSDIAINDTHSWFDPVTNVFNGSWYYLTLTWNDAADERKLYVNGQQQGSTDTTAFTLPSITDFIIGEDYDWSGQPINGDMDEFRIADTVRSDAWIATEYNNQSSTSTFYAVQSEETGPGPIAYWRFDEGYGATAEDSSANNNDGTLNNGTSTIWQDESMCVSGKCLYFDGNDDYAGVLGLTLVNEIETAWNSATSPKTTASFNVKAGDVLVAYLIISYRTYSDPDVDVSGGSLSWTMLERANGDEYSDVSVWTATADADKSMTVSFETNATNYFGGNVLVFRGSSGVGASAQTTGASGAPSLNITTTAINSTVVAGNSDEQAIDGSSRVWRTNAGAITELTYYRDASRYTAYIGNHPSVSSKGTYAVGLSAPSGQRYSIAAVEVKDTLASSTINGVKTVSFWAKPNSTTESIIDVNGIANITISSSVLQANNFTSPTIYIDGVQKTSFPDTNWHFVTVTTNTSTNTAALTIGKIGTTYYHGFIDEVKIYPYARTASQIKEDYAAGLAGIGTAHGVSAAFGSASDKWMSDGLVGYWRMDEATTTSGAIDSSGNSNTGTYEDNASTTAGKFGNGGVFDGVDDIINVNSPASLDNIQTTGSGMTVSLWVKNDQYLNIQPLLIGKGNANANGYWILFLDNEQIIRFMKDFGTAGYGEDLSVKAPFSNSYLGQWKHVILSWDGSASASNVHIYIDGVEITKYDLTNGTGNAVSDADLTLGIGNDTYSGSQALDGFIDEVRLYNRALSGDEVRKLYEWAPGPVAHWKMDEKSGTTAYDSAASTTFSGGNHGTIYGASWYPLGKFGNALKFDGVDGGVSVDDNLKLHLANFSIEFWINPSQWSQDSYGLITKRDSFATMDWGIYNTGGGNQEINMDVGESAADTLFENLDYSPPINQWHYIAVIKSDTNYDLYVDGILEGSDTSSQTWTDSDNILIGGYYHGQIDDVRIYNYARTQKQILEDMSGGSASGGNGGLYPFLHLKFDEGKGATAYDSSGYSNNGTLYPGTGGSNTATSAMWTFDGKNGKAIEFDGEDDYAVVNNFASNPEFTVSYWCYFDDDNDNCGISKYFNDSNDYVAFIVSVENSKVAFQTWVDGYENLESQTIAKNIWHHLVFTFDTKYAKKIYVDGHFSASSNKTSPIDNYTQPLGLGVYNLDNLAGGKTYLGGQIDDVKIYPYALNEDEIKQDFNSGFGAVMGSVGKSDSAATSSNAGSLEYCVPGSTDYCIAPVGEWKMDEKTGATAYDISGQGNDGTISGASWSPLGKFGNALKFDGVDDYIDLGSPDKLDSLTVPLTYSLWINPNSAYTSGVALNFYPIQENARTLIGIYSGYLYAGGSSHQDMVDLAAVGNPIKAGQWNHIVYVDGGDNGIYINGIRYATSTPDYMATSGFTIGAKSTTENFFNGLIDDVRIYNYARTPAQIAYDFNRGKPIAHWRFDECKGGTIYDSAKSWNGGTASNGTLHLGTSGVTATGTCASSSSSFWYNGRTGKYNSAGSFDGTDDYVEVNLNLSGTNVITLSFWMWWNAFANNDDLAMESSVNYNYNMEGFIINPNSSGGDCGPPGVFEVDLRGDTPAFSSGYFTRPTANTWHHYVVIFDKGKSSSEVDSVYVDGISKSLTRECDHDNTNNFGNLPLYLMSRAGSTLFGNGQIDEVKIWNYALTAEQVKSEYNGGAVRFGE